MGVFSIGTELPQLNAERQRRLHTPQATLVSLFARLTLGENSGSRLDRCRYRQCRQRWGEYGCRSRREADAATAALREATTELPVVVGVCHLEDPFALWEVTPI